MMVEFEKGSMEEALINLQNVGLIMNEHKQQGKPITYEQYEDLLSYAINVVRQVDTCHKEMADLFDQVKERWEYMLLLLFKIFIALVVLSDLFGYMKRTLRNKPDDTKNKYQVAGIIHGTIAGVAFRLLAIYFVII